MQNATKRVCGSNLKTPARKLKIYSIKFLVTNPLTILEELGYEIPKIVNTWKKAKSVFITKSKYKNSLFENENIEIQRVLSNV